MSIIKKIDCNKNIKELLWVLENNKNNRFTEEPLEYSSIFVTKSWDEKTFFVRRKYWLLSSGDLLMFFRYHSYYVKWTLGANSNLILECRMNLIWITFFIIISLVLGYLTLMWLLNFEWDAFGLMLLWAYTLFWMMIYATRFYMHDLINKIAKIINQ